MSPVVRCISCLLRGHVKPCKYFKKVTRLSTEDEIIKNTVGEVYLE